MLLQVQTVGKVLVVVVDIVGAGLKGFIQLSQLNVLCVAGTRYLVAKGEAIVVVLLEEVLGVVVIFDVVLLLVEVLVVGLVLSRDWKAGAILLTTGLSQIGVSSSNSHVMRHMSI